ncbi:hypothetical protein [Marinitoga aeolica]|uniref:Uncharacterized protein n=1 Tax=Marinitoga aeolica TaxID=2809031 RepID=A0ABY8PMY2_9BACT|nr:hypothetical protein [Marinitoga aeolica]WGS63955.1 hypothetical protein JRV97_06130 [Marinitoga aeolica]
MKNIIDILIEKWLFKVIKHAYYKPFKEIKNDESHFYFINFGTLSLNFFKLKPLSNFTQQLRNCLNFKNKLGIITLNNCPSKYIRYISEIAEIFDVPLIAIIKKDVYLLKENTLKKIKNNDSLYLKTTKFYFLNNSSELLYQLMDIRLENPDFLIVNNSLCKLENFDQNAISSSLSTYLLSIDNNKITIFKPENNKPIEYKLKEHFILKFNLNTLAKYKNGITKLDEKKLEILLKYI